MLFLSGFELYSRWVPPLGHVVKFTDAISGANVILNPSNEAYITLRCKSFCLLGLIDIVYPI